MFKESKPLLVLQSLLLTHHFSTQPRLRKTGHRAKSRPLCARSPRWCDQNLVFHRRGSTTGSQPWQWNRFFLMAMIIRRPFHIKTVEPASWAHFFSKEPVGRTPPLSYQTLEQTPRGKGDAEETRTKKVTKRFHLKWETKQAMSFSLNLVTALMQFTIAFTTVRKPVSDSFFWLSHRGIQPYRYS